MIAVGLPMAIFVTVYFRKRDVCDLHHAILGKYIFWHDTSLYYARVLLFVSK